MRKWKRSKDGKGKPFIDTEKKRHFFLILLHLLIVNYSEMPPNCLGNLKVNNVYGMFYGNLICQM